MMVMCFSSNVVAYFCACQVECKLTLTAQKSFDVSLCMCPNQHLMVPICVKMNKNLFNPLLNLEYCVLEPENNRTNLGVVSSVVLLYTGVHTRTLCYFPLAPEASSWQDCTKINGVYILQSHLGHPWATSCLYTCHMYVHAVCIHVYKDAQNSVSMYIHTCICTCTYSHPVYSFHLSFIFTLGNLFPITRLEIFVSHRLDTMVVVGGGSS